MNSDVGYWVQPLSGLLVRHTEEYVAKVLSEYRSVRGSDTEDFLHTKAIPMEKGDLSRTFLAMTPDMRILGYVSLSIKCMRVPEDTPLSRNVQRQINVDSRTRVAQSYLIGQLFRSADAPKGLGAVLIRVVMRRIRNSKMNVGCRIGFDREGMRLFFSGDDYSRDLFFEAVDRMHLDLTHLFPYA